uniref:DUF913 domain-containing protein n=1 Tax=Macrostomum lignano TaxID=282301 RepID=A0A1I8J8H2_9PLAT
RSRLPGHCGCEEADCKALVDWLRTAPDADFLARIKGITHWVWGKCELGLWADKTACEPAYKDTGAAAASTAAASQAAASSGANEAEGATAATASMNWTLAVDLPENGKLASAVCSIMDFTSLLVEHAVYRSLYGSFDRLLTLFQSRRYDVTLSVLGLLLSFAKSSTQLEQLDPTLYTVLYSLSRSWCGPASPWRLADWAQDGFSHAPPRSLLVPCRTGSARDAFVCELRMEPGGATPGDPSAHMELLLRTEPRLAAPDSCRTASTCSPGSASSTPTPAAIRALLRVHLLAIAAFAYLSLVKTLPACDVEGLLSLPDTSDDYMNLHAAVLKTVTSLIQIGQTQLVETLGLRYHHGLLPSLLRRAVSSIRRRRLRRVTAHPARLKQATAILSTLYHITSSHDRMSPSPSLLDPLLQLVQWQAAPDNWLGLCIRSVRVLDCLCNLAASQARLPGVLFSALLGRLQAELQLQQQQPANCLQKLGLLKRLLHLLKRLVTEPDFADSVRRTVDSGQLLRLVRCLLDCAPALRFAGADLLAAYIQHEPSSLSAMQESGITDQVLDSLKVPQHRDLLLNLPPILAALSLNQRGADAVLRRGVLQQLVSIFADPAYLPALTAKKSMQPAAMLGSLASEVVRNDQRLKDAVVEAVKDSLTRLVEEAKASAAAAAVAAAASATASAAKSTASQDDASGGGSSGPDEDVVMQDASFASSVSTGGAGSSGNGAAGTSNVGANATTGGAAAAASSDPGAASNRASRLLVFAQSMVYRTAIERADSQIAAGSVDSAASRALVDAGVLPLLLELAAQLRPAEPAIGHVATFIRLLVMADADPEQMVSTLLSLINDQLPSECNPRSAAICSLLERLVSIRELRSSSLARFAGAQPLLKKLLYQLYRTAAWQCAEAAH